MSVQVADPNCGPHVARSGHPRNLSEHRRPCPPSVPANPRPRHPGRALGRQLRPQSAHAAVGRFGVSLCPRHPGPVTSARIPVHRWRAGNSCDRSAHRGGAREGGSGNLRIHLHHRARCAYMIPHHLDQAIASTRQKVKSGSRHETLRNSELTIWCCIMTYRTSTVLRHIRGGLPRDTAAAEAAAPNS